MILIYWRKKLAGRQRGGAWPPSALAGSATALQVEIAYYRFLSVINITGFNGFLIINRLLFCSVIIVKLLNPVVVRLLKVKAKIALHVHARL